MNSDWLLAFFESGFIVCLILSILFFIISVVLYFLLDIRKLYRIETERDKKKTVEEMLAKNALTGRLLSTSQLKQKRVMVEVTDSMAVTEDFNSSPITPPREKVSTDTSSVGMYSDFDNQTTLLNDENQTTLLNQSIEHNTVSDFGTVYQESDSEENENSAVSTHELISGESLTTVLNQQDEVLETADKLNENETQNNGIFIIKREIILVHTTEDIN